MVNTLRNGEIAIMNWIDIDKPTKGYHFKDLNQSKSGVKFKSVVNESNNETPAFKYKQGATTKDELKAQILATTLYDAVMKYRSNIVKEGKTPNLANHEFFNRGEWQEFEKHGKMIAQFMGADEEQIGTALANMKKAFISLGSKMGEQGENALDKGLETLNQMDMAFEKDNISNLQPKIRVSRLLELLSSEYNRKEAYTDPETGKPKTKNVPTQKMVDGNVYEYSIPKFIDIVLNPLKGLDKMLNDLQPSRGNLTLMDILSPIKKDPELIEIFRKIVTQDKYTKNNAAVGKVEIALAMFFKNCRLADDKGDILLNGVPVEIKGSQGIITERVERKNYDHLYGISQKDLNVYFSDVLGDLPKIKSIVGKRKPQEHIGIIADLSGKKIKPDQLDAIDNPTEIDGGDELGDEGEDEEILQNEAGKPKKKQREKPPVNLDVAKQFLILFCALVRMYFAGKVCKDGKGYMLIFTTEDDLGIDISTALEDSKLLNSRIVKVKPDLKSNWIDDGVAILKQLQAQGMTVSFSQAHDKSQAGFKVVNFKG